MALRFDLAKQAAKDFETEDEAQLLAITAHGKSPLRVRNRCEVVHGKKEQVIVDGWDVLCLP